MKIYHYHESSGAYLGESEARLDPLELKLNNREVFLIPAYATDIEPPEITESQTLSFENGEWKVN